MCRSKTVMIYPPHSGSQCTLFTWLGDSSGFRHAQEHCRFTRVCLCVTSCDVEAYREEERQVQTQKGENQARVLSRSGFGPRGKQSWLPLTVWLARRSKPICPDTDTTHLKYTPGSLNNRQLALLSVGWHTKAAALLFVLQQATIWPGLYLICTLSVSTNFCPRSKTTLSHPSWQTKITRTMEEHLEDGSKGEQVQTLWDRTDWVTLITTLNISRLPFLISHISIFSFLPTGLCSNMPCLLIIVSK